MTTDILHRGKLIVKKSIVHNYGVYADQDFAKDEIIEECYPLLTQDADNTWINYYFDYHDKVTYLLPLGYGALYNHSSQPNARYQFDTKKSVLTFKAMRPIKRGDEIFIYYGANWFSTRKIKVNSFATAYCIRHLIKPFLKVCFVITALLGAAELMRWVMPLKFF